jgi:hypothetical protein
MISVFFNGEFSGVQGFFFFFLKKIFLKYSPFCQKKKKKKPKFEERSKKISMFVHIVQSSSQDIKGF